MSGRRWTALIAFAVVLAISGFAVFRFVADDASGGSGKKVAKPKSTRSPFPDDGRPHYDRNYKADLFDALKKPPQFIVFGGSRAQRFEPDYIHKLTGRTAFNFALQSSRPEDAYAVSKYVFSKTPGVKPHFMYAVQATSFGDKPLHPGLLYDERYAQWFPPELVARQKALAGPPKTGGIGNNRYSPRGLLLYNSYDAKIAAGRPQERALKLYIANLVPKAAASGAKQTRAHHYFEKLLKLYNDNGVTPAIVVMPYHPLVLEAFRQVGWQEKNDALLAYLHELQKTYKLNILDYTEISSFGGDPKYFYDGAHIMKENARLLLDQAVKDAPDSF